VEDEKGDMETDEEATDEEETIEMGQSENQERFPKPTLRTKGPLHRMGHYATKKSKRAKKSCRSEYMSP